MAETRDVEEELLRRCAAGDAAAYRELVGRLEKPLINFILRFVGERHVAEDLFQETFVRVIRSLSSYQPTASLSTWIHTIARNLCLDHLKSRRRHREVTLDGAAAGAEGRLIYFKDILRAGAPGPDERAESDEDARRVAEGLKLLSPAKREALVLRLYSGLSYAEIAEVQGCPLGTIKFRIHEAIQDLAKRLGRSAEEESAARGG